MRALPLVLALVASAPAAAAEWYAELHAGTTRARDAASTAERVEGAYGAGVGVAYGEYFSTQLDWHTLGENANLASCPLVCAVQPLPEHGYALRMLPRLPLAGGFALELGLGWMAWEGDLDLAGAPLAREGFDAMYSYGVAWRFARRWTLTVEAQVLELADGELDWTGATLRYRF